MPRRRGLWDVRLSRDTRELLLHHLCVFYRIDKYRIFQEFRERRTTLLADWNGTMRQRLVYSRVYLLINRWSDFNPGERSQLCRSKEESPIVTGTWFLVKNIMVSRKRPRRVSWCSGAFHAILDTYENYRRYTEQR